jgi:hypothetical protein
MAALNPLTSSQTLLCMQKQSYILPDVNESCRLKMVRFILSLSVESSRIEDSFVPSAHREGASFQSLKLIMKLIMKILIKWRQEDW